MVFLKTGKRYCDGTPYQKYSEIEFSPLLDNASKITTADILKVASEEFEFLKSLREKNCFTCFRKVYHSGSETELVKLPHVACRLPGAILNRETLLMCVDAAIAIDEVNQKLKTLHKDCSNWQDPPVYV